MSEPTRQELDFEERLSLLDAAGDQRRRREIFRNDQLERIANALWTIAALMATETASNPAAAGKYLEGTYDEND